MSVELDQSEVVDTDLRAFIAARQHNPDRDADRAGKWVARRKVDASIVAGAETYDELEDALASDGIDPETVVLGFVYEPDDLHVL